MLLSDYLYLYISLEKPLSDSHWDPEGVIVKIIIIFTVNNLYGIPCASERINISPHAELWVSLIISPFKLTQNCLNAELFNQENIHEFSYICCFFLTDFQIFYY